jgi:UDP-galactopyranose mutase
MELNNYDIIIVGCGLSGIVIAERFALLQNKKILIIDKRNHIGGNCYDYYDEKTNILMNKYGAHLFHTNDEEVFNYINQYGNWSPWEHKVLGLIDGKHLPIPANITTVNEIFNLDIKNKEEMNNWLSENQVKYENITNGEEMAKSRVGEVLYEKIFKHYTYKQWKKYPNELAPEVLARIPVRNNFDDRYFSDKYQVLPEKGYTAFFQSILDKHKHNIDVKLNYDFFDIKDQITKDHIVIYTGPIDAYFADKGLPKLEYRSIDFHIERQMNTECYQPYSVVNYPSADTPYTRCVEYKHFLNQESDHTVYVKETTTDKGEPYYPVLNDKNKELYKKYQKMAEEEGENIHFLGRLASYKYFNMDQAINNSLDYYEKHFKLGVEESNSGKNNNDEIISNKIIRTDLYKKNIDPIIKIYCNNRKRVWFKHVNKCTNLIENPNTSIIFTKNGEQKILPGVDYVGPDLFDKPCSDLEQAKNLTFTDDTLFYFYIRGHIRNSFNTDRLKNFVKLLKSHFPNIKFILQTWKQKECKNNESWKRINECNTIISKQIIENYFKDETITKQCLIINEKSIELIGSTNGTIGVGPCPKLGWKNMWYGIYKGLEHLDIKSSNNFIVSFRYDYFDIAQSTDIDEEKIIQFIKNNLDNKNIQFIKYNIHGTDNLYMGKYNKIKALIEKFHFKLDYILNMNKKIFHQEYLVNIIAETI